MQVHLMKFSTILLAMSLLTGWAHSAEEKINPQELPKAIASAIKTRFPKGNVSKAEKETENNQVVYDIELTENNLQYEMDVRDDGVVLEIEKEVPQDKWPKPLPGAIAAKYPTAKIKVVMEVDKIIDKKELPQHFETTLDRPGEKELEVIVSMDGNKVSTESSEEPKKE